MTTTTTPETEKPTMVNVASGIIAGNTQALVGRADVISTELRTTSNLVRQAMKDRHAIEVLLGAAREKLEDARDQIFLKNIDDIKALGSNEDLREANLRRQLADEMAAVRNYTKALHELDFQLKLATREHESAQHELRVIESVSRIVGV